MCIIVDANKLGEFLASPPNDDAMPIRQWLERPNGAGTLVYSTGGKFAGELGRNARTKLAVYAQAGKARLVAAHRFSDDADRLRASGQLRSDDPHVLALARASGARLLYTGDQDLIADFKDSSLIRDPRGKVYSSAANVNLLTPSACAKPTPARGV